ncbi:DUF2474 domain-containing protein [Acetobacter sp. TBRC 12305]|uniref:DUF2474 domain-containing protein n=1 Tax=Acetobacter garciniae TaxID=2817435 RepID=A0A939HN36_9PROT|nr:DUF2474 domain-containing protein [Acetobacter garciniae]MBO1326732.1 DUF2474 domain-containing protein [Acetobacter garciniae]MBX0346472.1 DUF2474 domain-containing protein [Acetobacter garciniae]
MPTTNQGGPQAPATPRHVLRRLGWFVAIWCMSTATFGLVAFLLRLMIPR